jgi:ATP-dependent helicase YprA (DUF1998 family)
VHPSFAPYVHQQKAYERLCGNDGRSTLIATGTGSGTKRSASFIQYWSIVISIAVNAV